MQYLTDAAGGILLGGAWPLTAVHGIRLGVARAGPSWRTGWRRMCEDSSSGQSSSTSPHNGSARIESS
jgi:hypothetical protein